MLRVIGTTWALVDVAPLAAIDVATARMNVTIDNSITIRITVVAASLKLIRRVEVIGLRPRVESKQLFSCAVVDVVDLYICACVYICVRLLVNNILSTYIYLRSRLFI